MELKTNFETMKRIAEESERLVEQLKEYIFRTGIGVGDRDKINKSEANELVQLIAGRLEKIDINGDENVLSDMITIYDKAIKSIEEELKKNSELEDDHLDKFNDATIESFKEVQEVLKSSEKRFATPIKSIFDKFTEEIENGNIDKEYREKKLEEIETDKRIIEEEIDENTSGLNTFEAKTREERKAYDEMAKLINQYFKLKERIKEINGDLANPDLAEEEKEKLKAEKLEKEKTLVGVFKDISNRTNEEEEYKQKEKESDEDYLKRVEAMGIDMYVKKALTLRAADLKEKIKGLKDTTIKIYDEETKTFKEVKIKDYINIEDSKQLAKLSDKIETDRNLNREALREKKEKVEELDKSKENYLNEKSNANEYYNSENLPGHPKEMGVWDKFKKRMQFNREHGRNGIIKSFFKSFSKSRDNEIFEEEMKKYVTPNDTRKKLLKDIEVKVKSGEATERIKAAVKRNLFKDRDIDRDEK